MTAPAGTPAELAAYLDDLDQRIALLETPQGFGPAFTTLSTNLTSASAAQQGGRFGIATDLKTVVWSNGVHWYRADTGAQIV